MSTREEIINGFYGQSDEDGRLSRTRHGQLEYRTTMAFIRRYIPKGAKIIEIGAGTGRYSVALAKEGMDVTAVELVKSNLDILRENGRDLDNLKAFQGDAADLGRFDDDSFDAALVFGPMYHLYEPDEVNRAMTQQFTRDLLFGGADTGELLDRARNLNMDIVRPHYLVTV